MENRKEWIFAFCAVCGSELGVLHTDVEPVSICSRCVKKHGTPDSWTKIVRKDSIAATFQAELIRKRGP